ncbi:MAG: YaeQ family protein [Vicinamibacterales bacterium]
MALTATIYNFDIDLADHDRGVFENLQLRVARHPSESEDYLWTRVLAYALEFTDGIAFSSGGLSAPDEPPIAVRDLTGTVKVWIDIGTPDPARLHRAAKATPRVAVYVQKDSAQFLERLAGAKIHQADAIDIISVDRQLLADLGAVLDRRMNFSLSVSDGELFVALAATSLTGRLTRHKIGA